MPVHLTKGDIARQPAMCAEIAALRPARNAHKHRLGYLNTKTSPSADEVAEKGPLETEIAKCDTAIGDLHQKVKHTASVDLNKAAKILCFGHLPSRILLETCEWCSFKYSM